MSNDQNDSEFREAVHIPPTITREEAKTCQRWAGMDGAVAWHLIERHAENWADIGLMMDAWLEANRIERAQPDEIAMALGYSRNFANANPGLSSTAREHILGLCTLLERAMAAELSMPFRHWVFTAAEGLRFYIDRMEENGDVTGPRHLLWMLGKIGEGMSATKACRWIGWIQCAIVASGVATMKEMKEHNDRHREWQNQ